MDHVAAPADNSLHRAAGIGSGRIVAAVGPQESHWFLDRLEGGAEREFGFSFTNLGRSGWGQTAREIEALNPEVLLTCWSTPALSAEWLRGSACRLRYVCHLTGSVRHVVPRFFLENGGLVTNWGNVPASTVAEHALLLALASLRNLPRWPEVLNQPESNAMRMEALRVRTLFGRRVGIHGFGQVAHALVRLLAPFDVTISAYSHGVPAESFAAAGVRQAASLGELTAHSDVVFECEALTPFTRGTLGASELAALRDGGVFVNVARAALVDEAALLREAQSGRIAVALDVFAVEPLPADSPWRRIPGVVLSPHIAGPTFDQYEQCGRKALANIRRYLKREALEFPVTPEIYDRST